MKKLLVGFIIVGLTVFLLITNGPLKAWCQETNGFESRSVNIWSDGTRLSGDLFYPKGLKPGDKLPAIILSLDGAVYESPSTELPPYTRRQVMSF